MRGRALHKGLHKHESERLDSSLTLQYYYDVTSTRNTAPTTAQSRKAKYNECATKYIQFLTYYQQLK